MTQVGSASSWDWVLESLQPRRMQVWSVALSAAIAANSQPTLLRPLTSARTWELREDSPDSLPNRGSRKSSRTLIRTGELSL